MEESINLLKAAQDNWRKYKRIYPYFVQIGVGGTGGYLVQHIAQLLGTTKTKASYVIADPDVIEPKNLGNQLFLPSEVGLKKADVLASRYSNAYDFDIGSYSDGYIESAEQLLSLFSTEYMDISVNNEHTLFLPIIIGCVDNNYSRRIMYELFNTSKTCIWIDAGNESAVVPNDWQTRPQNQWTAEELKAYHDSGWTGQIICGVNTNLFKQPCLVDTCPEILNDMDEIRPSEMSCTQLSASDPQRLIVNKFAALSILSIVTSIVEDYSINTHITFIHPKKGYMRSTGIKKVV